MLRQYNIRRDRCLECRSCLSAAVTICVSGYKLRAEIRARVQCRIYSTKRLERSQPARQKKDARKNPRVRMPDCER